MRMGYGAGRDAFLYRNGSYQALSGPPAFNGAHDIRLVFGLNNKDLIVGAGFDYDAHSGSSSWLEHYQPLIYRPGQTGANLNVSTQALGGAAYAANDRGVIVGCEFLSNALPRAVQWEDGAVAPVSGMEDATESVAFDVCEEGTIAGMKKVDGQWKAFLTDAHGTALFAPSTMKGVGFEEFWHVSKFGALGWGSSNTAQRLYWLFPDDDQDGLPDILEQEIVDADPFDSISSIADVTGNDDFDGDGLTNAQEWTAKTDPAERHRWRPDSRRFGPAPLDLAGYRWRRPSRRLGNILQPESAIHAWHARRFGRPGWRWNHQHRRIPPRQQPDQLRRTWVCVPSQ